MYKPHKLMEGLLLLLVVVFLCVGFVRQRVHPTQAFQGQNSKVVGSLTELSAWSLQWQCTAASPSTLILQIDSDHGHLLRAIACNSGPQTLSPLSTGTFYLAVSGSGDWIVQISTEG